MRRNDHNDNTIVQDALEALKPTDRSAGVVSPLDELSERRMTDSILNRFDEMRRTPKTDTKRRLVHIAAAAILLGSGVLGYALVATPSAPEPLATPVPPPRNRSLSEAPVTTGVGTRIPGSRFALLFGEVYSEDGEVVMGKEIPTAKRIRTLDGQTALSLPTGIAAGLAERTTVRVLWSGGNHYGISVLSGMVLFSVDPSQARGGFFVDTPAGTVRVKGTLFTVIVSPDMGVFVKLHRGRLTVEKVDGTLQTVTPGTVVRLNGDTPVAPSVQNEIFGQLQALRCMDQGTLFTELSHFECLGTGERDRLRSVSQRPSAGTREKTPSIRELMRTAREQKANGDWPGAASSYQELIRRFPNSDEARTSMVSLAQMQLTHLGNPNGALVQFSRYLSRPGPLTQEALYGKAEAFRAMGNIANERQTLEQFLRKYPKGLYAVSVSKRLRQLRSSPSE